LRKSQPSADSNNASVPESSATFLHQHHITDSRCATTTSNPADQKLSYYAKEEPVQSLLTAAKSRRVPSAERNIRPIIASRMSGKTINSRRRFLTRSLGALALAEKKQLITARLRNARQV